MLNRTFGEIRVIGKSDITKKWICQCSCGNVRESNTGNLNAGHVTACKDCSKKRSIKLLSSDGKQYLRKKFHKLTVLKFVSDKKNQRQGMVECSCDCGGSRTVKLRMLVDGKVKSCGCSRYSNPNNKNVNMDAKLSTWKKTFGEYKARAKRKEMEWGLSLDFLIKTMSKNCHYCNSEPSIVRSRFITKSGKYLTNNKQRADEAKITRNGIDRVDSRLGYIESNCLPCCTTCNKAKNDLSYDEFISWIKKLKDNLCL